MFNVVKVRQQTTFSFHCIPISNISNLGQTLIQIIKSGRSSSAAIGSHFFSVHVANSFAFDSLVKMKYRNWRILATILNGTGAPTTWTHAATMYRCDFIYSLRMFQTQSIHARAPSFPFKWSQLDALCCFFIFKSERSENSSPRLFALLLNQIGKRIENFCE